MPVFKADMRHFIRSADYALLSLNQRVVDGVRENGTAVEFELPPQHTPSEMVMRVKDGKPGPWLQVYDGANEGEDDPEG